MSTYIRCFFPAVYYIKCRNPTPGTILTVHSMRLSQERYIILVDYVDSFQLISFNYSTNTAKKRKLSFFSFVSFFLIFIVQRNSSNCKKAWPWDVFQIKNPTYRGSSCSRSEGRRSIKFRKCPYEIDSSVSAFKNRIIATALSSLAGSPAFSSDANISLFCKVPDLLRHREVYARRMVGSFCSMKDKNCFQPNDFENMWLLVRFMNSRAYRLGNFLFLIAISRSSIVTWPSPSLSSSSKNLLPVCVH